jgi:hypothetical protein
MIDFSEILYRCPGRFFGPEGTTYESLGVYDEEELDVLLKKGWFRSMPEAVKAFKGE